MSVLWSTVATGSGGPGRAFGELLPWLLLLIGVVIAGAVFIYLARRTVNRSSGDAGGFTLHELRKLHASGQLSDEEFERARDSVIGRVSASGDEDASSGEDRPGGGTR